MQYFMSRSIALSKTSSAEILNKLQRPMRVQYEPTRNSRLINIQLRSIMSTLIENTYLTVLENLERRILTKQFGEWATGFCAIMILRMCAEIVQTTADLRIVNAMDDRDNSTIRLDKHANVPSRKFTIEVAESLEQLPIAGATDLFHLVYKTNRPKDGGQRKQGFNPIRDGPDNEQQTQLGKSATEFVRRLQSVLRRHRMYAFSHSYFSADALLQAIHWKKKRSPHTSARMIQRPARTTYALDSGTQGDWLLNFFYLSYEKWITSQNNADWYYCEREAWNNSRAIIVYLNCVRAQLACLYFIKFERSRCPWYTPVLDDYKAVFGSQKSNKLTTTRHRDVFPTP